MRVFIAPLDFDATVDDVRDLFAPFGEVENVILVPNRDRPWQRNRGYAFVDMAEVEARRAIVGLTGQLVGGRKVRVEETRGRSGGRR